MKDFIKRVIRLFTGLMLFAIGIVMTINANLGLSPWDVFHKGISNTAGITMGQASIGVGVTLVVIDSLLGEKLGWGTLCNMFFVGLFMDFLMQNKLIPMFDNVIFCIALMLGGMFVIGVASYFYIGAGLGSGPRDGLMVALTKRTGKSVRLIRNTIELIALLLGYLMGGFVGVGTLVMALSIGYFVQFAFKLFKFDVKSVKHRFIEEDVRLIKSYLRALKNKNISS